MDIAKAITCLANENNIENIVKGNRPVSERSTPMVMIPTTAGSGSESTQFSVINIGKTKYSLAHENLLADYAILDATFTLSLPPYITACTGIDALCQAIEGYWAVNSTDKSREYSKLAIEKIVKVLEKTVNNPDFASREILLDASNLSGRAINISKTTASHAISYPITSFFNIPHGHAVALTLPSLLEFNFNVSNDNIQDKRGIDFVKDRIKELSLMLNSKSIEETKNYITQLMKAIELKTKLSELGIRKTDINTIVENGLSPQRVSNNPRKMSEKDLRKLLSDVL